MCVGLLNSATVEISNITEGVPVFDYSCAGLKSVYVKRGGRQSIAPSAALFEQALLSSLLLDQGKR